ncbi:possible competence protein, ComEC [Psychrobacter arcticus 273-4]|uniref:Possible competence protein, ComEC n=1 Tax=Psychrobacter arcticus (strain DSM 17307 / VKM B-2377 / 273-4) TaxID=259536 RepID=Q4FTM0_PSYA2|nr:ComEC/Rec2 family competence protein [Psychrobacter arcticus]AAZ18638.1 possible competence protein, ComEC [Psychrobacter arcticus 273-4]
MYWLIGSFIIIAMMGVLAVADSTSMPIVSLFMDSASTPVLTFSLVFLTLILMVVSQFSIPAANTINPVKSVSHHSTYACRVLSFVLIALLAIALIIGSGLQALMSHQQADTQKITEPMRIQALVHIEGISDSVYDAGIDTGYRQVATISQISPLVSELTAQDLDKVATEYWAEINNSLSSNNVKYEFSNSQSSHQDTLAESAVQGNVYRVLLNAYPKKPAKQSSKTGSKKKSEKSEKQNQIADLNHLQPGDRLFMTLTLAPLATSKQALNNPSGFDSYRWLRGRHIDGVANILATSSSILPSSHPQSHSLASDSYLTRLRTAIDKGRWQLRQHFYQNWVANTAAGQQAKAVTLSLLTGDRSLVNRETKDLYQLAGISHLLAISGTHVLFLAIVLAGIVILFINRLYPALYRYIPRWHVRWWLMISAAFIYALFTGFDVPAARTAWMLLAIGLTRLTLLPVSTMRILFALAVLMAWHDPYVLWQAGYWLSFIAVALLLKYEDTSQKQPLESNQPSTSHHKLLRHLWLNFKRLFKLQCWLFLALLPVTLLLFGKASLWGLVVNLFAIGLFGWIIVPLNLLAGLCYLILPAIANIIWTLVTAIVTNLHELISWLTAMPVLSDAWLYTPVNAAILLMALLAILPWLLPRGLISRWLVLPPLSLLVMTVYANQQSLTKTPTLYILPTGDQYISATLLQYPVLSDKDAKNSSWLFLTDHRPSSTKTTPSNLTADKFSATLKQQLGSLAVNKLEGIVVQSSSSGVTDSRVYDKTSGAVNPNDSEILPMVVAQLSQRLPVSQYWQAGRSERWSALQQAYKITTDSQKTATISAQRCESGKIWQLPNGHLTLQAITGWSKIDDASVWDCTIAIDSSKPIRVLKYQANDPLKSLPVTSQTLTSNSQQPIDQANTSQSRLILNADTHERAWQMWSLLCSVESTNSNITMNRTTWLGHSTSHISSEVISQQQIDEVTTYDNKPLEVALSSDALIREGD